MTNKELNAAIRKDLKENGIKRNDVSVKVRDSLYDTSVRITIKNPLLRKAAFDTLEDAEDENEDTLKEVWASIAPFARKIMIVKR